jgi:hypothetical protein
MVIINMDYWFDIRAIPRQYNGTTTSNIWYILYVDLFTVQFVYSYEILT